ncbi:GntR family transcriptional regulator [Anoxynatronum buryatiense]|uniref:Transcriptional regulator, GntR family n=1 Tax=Anoxynatronum buryatiense TaxID=489973 RepID=A0AA45WYQ0_9CLOT|nr:GntR family transcriptional regulator [Anoxynatronum buryatiense]SMP68480.1 transcriptional regulator, GntR family [Anoxynatronum buryatiense]
MNIELGLIDDFDLRPIRDIVYENLRNAIMEQRLKRGERLVENTIAEKMNISRTPVREALRQLESEGLVVHMPRRGTVVQGITREDALDIYNIREVLEGLVVRLACERRSEAEVENLHKYIEQMETAIHGNAYEKLMELHHEFNDEILQAAQSKRLSGMVKHLHEYLASMRTVSLESTERQEDALQEHREIVKAIEERRTEEGEAKARIHVQKAREAFLRRGTIRG